MNAVIVLLKNVAMKIGPLKLSGCNCSKQFIELSRSLFLLSMKLEHFF